MNTQTTPSVFAARALIQEYLSSKQPLGTVVLAEDAETGLKLIGFAAADLPSFMCKLSHATTADGAVNVNLSNYAALWDGTLVDQYRFVGFLSPNGTIQTDSQNIALSLHYASKDAAGVVTTKTADVRYTVMRGFANDLAQLKLYLLDANGPKVDAYSSVVFKAQTKPFTLADSDNTHRDPAEIVAAIPELAPFAALPEFALTTRTTARIPLKTLEEMQAFKELVTAIPKDNTSGLRNGSAGLKRVDDLGVVSYLPWATMEKLRPAHLKTSTFSGELIWTLPDSLKAPEWTREDI